MSATTTPIPVKTIADAAIAAETAVLTAPDGSEPKWAKPIAALSALAIFGAIAVYVFWHGDHDMQLVIEGAAQGMAMTGVNYYLGSSSGSDKKTSMMGGK